ncbi:MAG: L-threonylcarbamoyladenylate synthase [Desulfobacteraceae bacterium]|jgi:L-threonylcarbamoyladenylate synthase|nr:L-threonylcarbamoyladenylate synthase [Desulfobacteraceae bacterium]
MGSPKIHRINPENPDPDMIQEASEIIRKGGVVGFPTRCLYGLAADAFNPDAVERIFQIKQRPVEKPILILIDSPSQLERLVTHISGSANVIMKRFWPGRVTLVFDASAEVPDTLTAGTGKIGIRLAAHPVAAALARAIQGPITGTSANISGCPGCYQIEDLQPAVTEQLDLILDTGPLRGGCGSTVVDVSGDIPRVLREGTVSKRDILSMGGKD